MTDLDPRDRETQQLVRNAYQAQQAHPAFYGDPAPAERYGLPVPPEGYRWDWDINLADRYANISLVAASDDHPRLQNGHAGPITWAEAGPQPTQGAVFSLLKARAWRILRAVTPGAPA